MYYQNLYVLKINPSEKYFSMSRAMRFSWFD